MKNRTILTILLIISSFTAPILGSNTTNLSTDSAQIFINTANNAYQNKDFQGAIYNYLQLCESNYESASLFYNLGNAYYQTGDLANAILWYERALRLAPNNADIKHNIAFVNQKLTDKIDILPEIFISRWWKAMASLFSGKTWTILSILFNILFFGALLLLFISRRSGMRNLATIIGCITLPLLILSIIFAHHQTYHYKNNPEAIIMATVVNGKSTPEENGTDLFIIHEGLKVKITSEMNEWYEIEIPNGEKGWIREENIEII